MLDHTGHVTASQATASQAKLPRRRRARMVLSAGFAALGLMLALTILCAGRQHRDMLRVQKILTVKVELADLISSVREAESGQRGFLLTGNEIYLVPYRLGVAAIPVELGNLSRLLAGTPDAARLAAISQLVAAKAAELSDTITLFQTGNAARATSTVRSGLGMQMMTDLRGQTGAVQDDESALLAAAQADADMAGWLLQAATLALMLAVALMAAFSIRTNRWQTAQLREAERAAAARAAELDRIFSLSTDILAVTSGGRFISLSPAWARILGHEVAGTVGRNMSEFLHPEDVGRTWEVLGQVNGGEAVRGFENRFRHADGSFVWLSWRAVWVPEDGLGYSVARDITQERAREEQLRQSQKMEAVGQLTGGVAHDFNNLLTIIMGSLELLQRGLGDGEPKLRKRAETAMDGARRAAALTQRLLAFSRQQPLAPTALDVNRLIAGMGELLARTLGEEVTLEMVAGAGLWQALADANQLENALLNLALNSRDAMEPGGRLTIETQNMFLDEAYAAANAEVRPGQYVQIAVSDTGTGMNAAVRAKLFEPFFTTKPQGKGTGLGLAQVYGFIKQSGGHVSVYSEPGQGTVVKLYLPRLRDTPAEAPAPAGMAEALRGHGETILVVEDEAGVRQFSTEILGELGYHVLAAENALTALPLLEAHPEIKMLFTDVVLSGPMNGRELAEEVARRRPEVIVLFTTGYTRNATIHEGRLDEGVHFIGKPFTSAALGRAVHRLLFAVG